MGRKIERWRGKGEIGVEISVIWSRRRDAWTYLGGADAGEEKRGFSYPNEAEAWNKRRVPHTVTSRIIPKGGKRAKFSPRASVAALHVVCVCVSTSCWRTNLRIRSVEEVGRIGGCCVISAGQWVFWQSKLGLGEFSPFGIGGA